MKLSFALLAGLSLTSAVFPAVRQVSIIDPTYKIAAYDITIPSNWKFDGTFIPGSSCGQAPFPVFRAYSPDGLSEMRRYPRLDWVWNNFAKGANHPDCLNLTQELSAKQALEYMMNVLQVKYERDAPMIQAGIDAKRRLLSQLNEQNASMAKMMKGQPTVQTADFAAAFAESKNGTFIIQSKIFVEVDCTHTPLMVYGQSNAFIETCTLTMRVDRAPKEKFAGIDWDHLGGVENSAWQARYMQDAMAKSQAQFAARMEAMKRAGEIRTRQHEDFMASMRASHERAMARAQESANARHAAAADWCDYALDQQTVTGSGGTTKVSSQYGHTWSDGQGHYYQTNYSFVDPNGFLSGTWSEQTKVHGDGTPY
jgi:hypothetical protein